MAREKRRRAKPISEVTRYLVGCAYLIYLNKDSHSDLRQEDIVTLYFDNIDRTIIPQTKTRRFAAPDWSLLRPYLFPWIRFNTLNVQVSLTRNHVKHLAFRIWEYLTLEGKVVMKHGEERRCHCNVRFVDIRGWWLATDGAVPPDYDIWSYEYDGTLPDDYRRVLSKVWVKPWPKDVSPLGLNMGLWDVEEIIEPVTSPSSSVHGPDSVTPHLVSPLPLILSDIAVKRSCPSSPMASSTSSCVEPAPIKTKRKVLTEEARARKLIQKNRRPAQEWRDRKKRQHWLQQRELDQPGLIDPDYAPRTTAVDDSMYDAFLVDDKDLYEEWENVRLTACEV